MTAIEGVFFDLDGTLLDTADDFVVTVNQMLSDHNRPPMEEAVIRRNVSAGSRTLMQMAFNLEPGAKLEDKRNQFLEYYDLHIKDISRHSSAQLFPGISTLLDELDHREITWGIVTNKPREYTLPLLDQLKLRNRSKVIICPEDVQQTKPHPESLFLACEQTRCAPEKSVYIGDHFRDIEAGRLAGMTTVAALYGYIADNDDPDTWQADVNVQNAEEFHQWLQKINWKIPVSA